MSIKQHIPNTITLLNLVSGACAVVLSLWGHFLSAFLFMLASAVFDFFDGFAARLLHSYSDIGKELDSLADVISFGLVPSIMFFSWYYADNHTVSALAFVPLMIAAFSALRLAKFNLDERQTTDFIGLATPLCALLVGSMVAYGHICRTFGASSAILFLLSSGWFIPVISIVLSLLLVSEIPMFSLKHKHFGFSTPSNSKFSLFLISLGIWPNLAFILCADNIPSASSLILTVTFASIYYILLNILLSKPQNP